MIGSFEEPDNFEFKEDSITPKHPRVFIDALEHFLEDNNVVITADDVDITREIELSSDAEIARVLFQLFQDIQKSSGEGSTMSEVVDNHKNFQRLVLRARELCAA